MISESYRWTLFSIPSLELPTKLRGVVLISPLVSFANAEPSFERNFYKDSVNAKGSCAWSTAFMNSPWTHTVNVDNYNQALTAPASWWHNLMVDDILIVAGEDEVLVDGIKEFGKIIQGAHKLVTIVVTRGEGHDQPNIDLMLGYHEPGEQNRVIQAWLVSQL